MARPAGTVVLVGMPIKDAVLSFPALKAVFSGKKLMGSVLGGAQILRDFPRFIRLAETGQLDLGALVTDRITLDQVNDGLATLDRAEGARTVIV
jgi:S-(hydroxymethyl)glutathione dehydrogenase/alcohol dehydrogenase